MFPVKFLIKTIKFDIENIYKFRQQIIRGRIRRMICIRFQTSDMNFGSFIEKNYFKHLPSYRSI